jgi:peptidoglycan/xylan/chitin deacetylase (PgdA/CDA1 family)
VVGKIVAKLLESRCAGLLYSSAAFPLFHRIGGVNPFVVYYHLVSDDEVPHVKNLYVFRTVAQFKRDLDVFLKFFRPLSLQDLMRSLKGEQALPDNAFLLTFDDGLRECYDVIAPILKHKGIPAAFFLCSAFVDNRELAYDFKKSLLADALKTQRFGNAQLGEVRGILEGAGVCNPDLVATLMLVDYRRRKVLDAIADQIGYDFSLYLKTAEPYLTSGQVGKLLAAGHGIGAHSIDHPRYEDIPLAEQLRQTRESIRFVKEQFRIGYGAFAFPSSDANVSREFFREVLGRGVAEVTFGNHGMMKDRIPRNVQRSSMERTGMPAEAILGRSYARRLGKMMVGRLEIKRP